MMIPRHLLTQLLTADSEPDEPLLSAMQEIGFAEPLRAIQRFQSLCLNTSQREQFQEALSLLLYALMNAASPDASLMNFQRYVQSVGDRDRLFETLAKEPRSIEILVRLFVGSQFLTEILLRNPQYLEWLTRYQRMAEFKSRQDFIDQGRREIADRGSLEDVKNRLRRFQQWEILRIAACDTFGLMDLKTVTLQLALLADAIVQVALEAVVEQEKISLDEFAVLAFGKLGGEELNYSSDIDLVFVCEQKADHYWSLGQKLIQVLTDSTDCGFLYRVDMRLRPWGSAGGLVTTRQSYADYLQKQGKLWEKQALLKARPIAGNIDLGETILQQLMPFIFDVNPQDVRKNVRDMKIAIEKQLNRKGHHWGEVKGGPGGIRDIEFLTQLLQLTHGNSLPRIRSTNTLDALVRLAEADLILPEEYRRLSSGYVILRTIEHALQLMHNKQQHLLPKSAGELGYLARRLDFPDAETFLTQYDRHTQSIREVYDRYLNHETHPLRDAPNNEPVQIHWGQAGVSYQDFFSTEEAQLHLNLIDELTPQQVVRLSAKPLDSQRQRITIVGEDRLGELSAICGMLFVHDFDIESGDVFTGANVSLQKHASKETSRKFVNVFIVRQKKAIQQSELFWQEFESELNEHLVSTEQRGINAKQGRLVKRVASVMAEAGTQKTVLLPVEIEVDHQFSEEATVLVIRGENSPGFLYELTNAVVVSGLSIIRMTIRSFENQVIDTLHVVTNRGEKVPAGERLDELRAAIVLTKHFTHLLPQTPNPEQALIHFQEFIENLFRQKNWLEQLQPLHDSDVLSVLAKLLGISNFLWHDFLRLQHENLFPIITNVAGLEEIPDRQKLQNDLHEELKETPLDHQREVLNAFKDREMMRVDLRHILGLQDRFGMFSRELTDVAEVVVEGALSIAVQQLQPLYGNPIGTNRIPASLSVCALGKFGGKELGYASDIELMFLYDQEGMTDGPEKISNLDYYQRLTEIFRTLIYSKRKGIFEIDLRLRPYGQAGRLAVSLSSFKNYFSPDGSAWPYERQALVKLRPVSGDVAFGQTVVAVRDSLIYRGQRFDLAAMRAMREKQIRQLVAAGTFNAKLSPGGLVDCEYLVQGLQMTFGHLDPGIREPNTREAMKALERRGILAGDARIRLRDAYRFHRRLIDALRIVRGDASDLTVPHYDSEEFVFLSRRMGYGSHAEQLQSDLEQHIRHVQNLVSSMDQLLTVANPVSYPSHPPSTNDFD